MKPIQQRFTHYAVMGVLVALINLLFLGQAQAVPSFARQTGMACTGCHTQAFGVNLNEYGRQFKLNGYTWGNANPNIPALSAMIEGSLTHTNQHDPDIPPAIPKQKFNTNNNLALDQASLFYAGRIYKQAGAFVQLTYDGIADRLALDNVDIRVTNQASWGDHNFVYGISFNNSPTTQDVWNTTPSWGFPAANSKLARSPMAAPIISSFTGQVGGATFYTMIDNLIKLGKPPAMLGRLS